MPPGGEKNNGNLSVRNIERLINKAIEVRHNAYAPYSKFQVGAAVLCADPSSDDGVVYCGCNVENASYGLCLCAERNAICTAVGAGENSVVAVAVAATPLATPCGACRQFIHEFGKDITVVCVDPEQPDSYQLHSIDALIPDCFGLE